MNIMTDNTIECYYIVSSITVSFRRNKVTEKSLITLEKISTGVYPELIEGVEMT